MRNPAWSLLLLLLHQSPNMSVSAYNNTGHTLHTSLLHILHV